MRTFKRLLLKKIAAFLPGFLQRYLETDRVLTRLSREWVFSTELNSPGKRKRAVKQLICQRAEGLQRDWRDLLLAVHNASCLPIAADEAYQVKLLLESAIPAAVVNETAAEATATECHPVKQPVLTVIMRPAHYSPQLCASLQSLQAQRFYCWEVLLLVNSDVFECLPPALADSRIRVVTEKGQGDLQYAGQLVLELAVGDMLHPDAVAELSRYLSVHDDIDLIYADHDHLDTDGKHCQPVFKPDWNPDLLVASDYISPAVFVRPEWLLNDGLEADKIGHIAKVLYHCNVRHADTTVSAGKGNNQSVSVVSRLKTRVVAGAVASTPGLLPASTRWQYPLPSPLPRVSLIIPTRNGLEVLKPCVDSILHKTTYVDYELIIVNNQSTDPATLDWLDDVVRDERVEVIRYDYPFNYSAINNFAAQHASGEIIGLINNDVEVISPGWLAEMAMHAWRPDIGCVGAKLYYSDGRIQHAGVTLGANCGTAHGHRYFTRDADGYCGRLKLIQNVSAVTGACLLLRRDLFERVGGLEEENLTIAYNDIDLCLKVRAAGFRNLWTPYAELYHHESVSRGRDSSPEQRKRYLAEQAWMQQRWEKALWCDPYYNPNLTAAREDFSLNMLYGLERG